MSDEVPQEPEESDPDTPAVTRCRSDPETFVFTEDGNEDGWIATDLTVDVEP